MAEPSAPYTASEVIALMEAAAKNGVLSFQAGGASFTLKGYTPPAPGSLESSLAAVQKELTAGRDWAMQGPPPFTDDL